MSSDNVTVDLGTPIRIKCNTKAAPSDKTYTYEWRDQNDKKIGNAQELVIARAKPEHEGVVYCFATLDNCTDREQSEIYVNYGESFLEIIILVCCKSPNRCTLE